MMCSHLTALALGAKDKRSCKCDEDRLATLAEALPQLRALNLYNCGELATDAGMQQCALLCIAVEEMLLTCSWVHTWRTLCGWAISPGKLSRSCSAMPIYIISYLSCRVLPLGKAQQPAAPENCGELRSPRADQSGCSCQYHDRCP
jgi:hypothetical protein